MGFPRLLPSGVKIKNGEDVCRREPESLISTFRWEIEEEKLEMRYRATQRAALWLWSRAAARLFTH